MWLPVVALIIGFCAVYLPRVAIAPQYSEYLGVAIVAAGDSIIGAVRSYIEGKFNDRVFVSGFFSNALLAVLLLMLGDALSIRSVSVAIMVALFIRIFTNLGFIRRYLVARLFEKRMTAEKVFPEP